jgi:hypothetical protein
MDMEMDEFVFFAHAAAGNPLALFAPITPFPGLSTSPGRIKYTAATLPVATDWLVPWHTEWAIAFGHTGAYRDFNGRRVFPIYGRGPSGDLARTGQVPVVLNVGGVEDVGDGSGNLIDSLPLQILHLLINFVLQDYQSGAWLAAPLVNGYSRVNSTSFVNAKAQTEARISGGHIGAFLLGWNQEGETLRQLNRRFYEHGIYLGDNKDGQLIGSAIDPGAAPVRHISDITDTIKGSFHAGVQRDVIQNLYNYRYGRLYTPPLPEPVPTTGDAMPVGLRRPQRDWEVDDQQITDGTSGKRAMELDFELTRDQATADDLAALHEEVLGNPGPTEAGFREGLCGTNIDLGDNVTLDHFEGISTTGWTGRLIRCERHELYLDGDVAFQVGIEGLDVEDLPES